MSSTATTTSRNNRTKRFTCHICCEKKDAKAMVCLTTCPHKQCKECLQTWIHKSEAAGNRTRPGCPFCRVEMTKKDTQAILERPYQPAAAASAGNIDTAELDDLTLQWIKEQTKECPGCGAFISKEDGTCAKMECLCGYRFCYDCGSQGAHCLCSPAHHVFTDNATRFKREQRYRMSAGVSPRILAARYERVGVARHALLRPANNNSTIVEEVQGNHDERMLLSRRNESAVGPVTEDAVRKKIQASGGEMSMKHLMEVFGITRQSTQERKIKFQEAINHLCVVKKKPTGRVLVLKPCFQGETPTATYAIRVRRAVQTGLQWSELGI